ncbi:hypothetical protein BJN42_27040 [Pseudomonas koreensis]|nr:hypothetical protein BJN42_27040 [Pseudomonas koreensis]
MQPLTLRVIAVFSLSPRVKLERGASLEALSRGAWERSGWADVEIKIVPTLCVGMQPLTLRVIAVLTLSIMVRLERGASLEALPRGAWERSWWADVEIKIVPTLCVGMQPLTLCVIAVLTLSIMVRLERGASLEALPRGAWERSGWGRCGDKDRSHALRHSGLDLVDNGEAETRSVSGDIPTRSVGMIMGGIRPT